MYHFLIISSMSSFMPPSIGFAHNSQLSLGSLMNEIPICRHTQKFIYWSDFFNKAPCIHNSFSYVRRKRTLVRPQDPILARVHVCAHKLKRIKDYRASNRHDTEPTTATATTTSAQLPGFVGWLKLIYCFKCNLHKNQTISSAERYAFLTLYVVNIQWEIPA